MRIARGAAAIDRTPEDPVVEDIAPGRAEALKAQPSDAESLLSGSSQLRV